MLPDAANSNNNANRDHKATTASSNRRYSLFNFIPTIPPSTSSLAGVSTSAGSGNNNPYDAHKNNLNERSNIMSSQICQRCKRFEITPANTSDNQTDAELKASRQVISLLQRQLELFRVEKEGLERLIISQSNNPFQTNNENEPASSDALNSDLLQFVDPPNRDIDVSSQHHEGDQQKVLLNLIRTQLYAKDEELVKLRFSLKEAQNDKERLMLQLHQLEEDNAKLKGENMVLNENLALRDQTIVSLSNEVFEQGVVSSLNQRRQSSFENFGNQQSLVKAQRQINKLVDTLDAYKKTNELLSDNVSKLTDRYSEIEKKEIEARSQCHELEAKCCQIQSKLLALLKEMESSSKQTADAGDPTYSSEGVICNESVKLLIKRLLEDKSLDIPLSWKEGNNSKNSNKISNSKYECDELGFYIIIEEAQTYPQACSNSSPTNQAIAPLKRHSISILETRPSTSNSTTSRLPTVEEAVEVKDRENFSQIRHEILKQTSVDATKSQEPRWHIKWDYFIKDFDKVDLSKSREFKLLLRSGVPQEYRCKVWKALVNIRIGEERRKYGPDYYQSLLEPNRPQSSSKMKMNPSSKQIELDLLRTLPNNKHFETLSSSGTVRLRRVLTAYSEHNPKVGYCQGMNRLAAVALLVLPEEEAFWCLSTIVDSIMPTGYYNDLWLAQVDSSVVMDFVGVKMPYLNAHFKQNCIELSLFAWFLTIFVDGTPPALFLRLWDSFLYEGDKILFRVALALLKMNESQLMDLNNSVAINNYLRSSVNAPMDIDRFFDIAFDWMNPLSSKSLRSKRQQYLQLMRSGFEQIGRSFLTPSPDESGIKDQERSRNDDSLDDDPSMISI